MTVSYRHYLLGLLLLIHAFNYVDRLALGLLLQDIKTDLDLTDTQLGLLTGIAFAAFYSVMGIPLARWADRGNRVTIIALTTGLWSAALALFSLAGSFTHLLLIRIGVAVGEAGCVPTAHSLIADYFNRAERPKAVATYMLAIPIASVIGYFCAGWLNQYFGWRLTFVFLGVPGLVLAALAWFTLTEPRVRKAAAATPAEATPGLGDVCIALWSNKTFRHLLIAFSVVSFFSQGIAQWKSAFFMRSHGLQTGELGTWFALIWGVGGVAGTYWGGQLAMTYATHNERLQLKALVLLYCGFSLFSAGAYLSPNVYVAFGFLTVLAVGFGAANGPVFALFQTLVPGPMRAMALAAVYLFANLIGMGLGPLAAGILSDVLRPSFGDESLRYTLLALCPGFMWCAWHIWCARRTVQHDVRATLHGEEK